MSARDANVIERREFKYLVDALTAARLRPAPRIAELPPRCWRDPEVPEWGHELVVHLDEPLPLLPGQAVTVHLLGEDATRADAPQQVELLEAAVGAPLDL